MLNRNIDHDTDLRPEVKLLLKNYQPYEIYERLKMCHHCMWMAFRYTDLPLDERDLEALLILHELFFDYSEALDYIVEENDLLC